MTNQLPSLLPPGLRDLLPPHARYQAHIVWQLLNCFESCGYEQVQPPLAEYETTLLRGKGEALATQTFRMMDTDSGLMLGIRPDMTLQVGRIATGRLGNTNLPHRLSYAGNVLRTTSEGLDGERQITQTGLELIGAEGLATDTEVITVVLEGLAELGFNDIVVDLHAPNLLSRLIGTNPDEEILAAINHKDSTKLPKDLQSRDIIDSLLKETKNIEALVQNTSLTNEAKQELEYLLACQKTLSTTTNATITIDPLDTSGLAYHEGLCFTLYHKESQKEIGRGGRYQIEQEDGQIISATGATLFIQRLLANYQAPSEPECVYISFGTSLKDSKALREQGYITIHATEPSDKPEKTAKELRCKHIFENGELRTV